MRGGSFINSVGQAKRCHNLQHDHKSCILIRLVSDQRCEAHLVTYPPALFGTHVLVGELQGQHCPGSLEATYGHTTDKQDS